MSTTTRTQRDALMARAQRVIPGGVYGHGALVPADHPKFFVSGKGCRITDVDGNEYIDFMCGFGPNLLGMGRSEVEEAAAAQQARGDCFSGPTEHIVELSEEMVRRVRHADWAMWMKNGTDATTLCVTLARAETRRRKILVAEGAYHGAAPWCTPSKAGVLAEDLAHLVAYQYNDLASLEAALESAGDDLAGIVASPFKHDAFVDQEYVDPAFARALRAACDQRGAALILDEVRAGLRLARGGSWESLDIDADLSAWGKAIANGHPISGIVARERYREAASKVYSTGTFWYAGAPMAAALATLRIVDDEDVPAALEKAGQTLRDGWESQAAAHGLGLRQTGPPQMPLVLFEDDPSYQKGVCWVTEAIGNGVYLHPFHNMFLCAAHRPEDLKEALERTDAAFAAVRRKFGAD